MASLHETPPAYCGKWELQLLSAPALPFLLCVPLTYTDVEAEQKWQTPKVVRERWRSRETDGCSGEIRGVEAFWFPPHVGE